MNRFNYSTLPEIEILEKEWYRKNRKSIIKKYGGKIHFNDKNAVFETFLIEIINADKFVVYAVEWKNQKVID